MAKRQKNRRSRVQKSVQTTTRETRWISMLLGSAVVTAVITALLQHFFLAPAQEKREFYRSLREQTAPQLRALSNLATVGKYMQKRTWVLLPPLPRELEAVERGNHVLVSRFGFNRVPVLGKADTVTLTFPAFVSSDSIRKEWESLRTHVASQLGNLDPEAFQEYQNLQLFLLRHPLPASDTLEASMIPWSEASVQAEWHELNNRICCMVERHLQLAQMAEDRSFWGLVQFVVADRIQNDTRCEASGTPPVQIG